MGPPAGLAYLPEADAFLAARREQGNVPGTAGLRVALVNLLGDMLASAAALRNPQGMSTAWITISDAPHLIAFDWRAATAAGANDGSLALSIDGVPAGTVTGVDNDTLRIDRIRLGAVSEMDLGTRGTYYFDAFESRR